MPRKHSKVYRKGIEERDRAPEFERMLEDEFPPLEAASGLSRRSFLKAAGFTMAGSLLASCAREPVEKAIPLLNRPEVITPGQANWYASTCGGCPAGCGILVKNRDGRPIKIEGNPEHPVSRGGLCAVGQAMVLGLYDSHRLEQPLAHGAPADRATVDAAIMRQLNGIREGVYILSGTVTSPTTKALIDRFLGRFDHAGHVEYDPVSCAAILDGHALTHGTRVLPRYRFDRAGIIVSLDADFLGTWISPVEFAKDYTRGRTLEGETPAPSRHVHFEGRMSLTGSNADTRIRVSPDAYAPILRALTSRVARHAGATMPQIAGAPEAGPVDGKTLDAVADQLWEARGKSLVVCGVNDVGLQCLVNDLNHLLGNYGATVDIEHPSYQRRGDDRTVRKLIDDMKAGAVHALLIAGVNPAYSLPDRRAFIDALQKVELTVAFADHKDETAELAQYVCAVHHPLESWNDAEVVAGVVGVAQPAIRPLGRTRSLRECLSAWMGAPQDDLSLLQAHWRRSIYPRREQAGTFQQFWDGAVQDGVARVKPEKRPAAAYRAAASRPEPATPSFSEDQYALVLYETVGMRDGRHAHNPWLHELPDPVTKAVWDNYVCIAPGAAARHHLSRGDIVRVSGGAETLELPVQIQPGQHERVVAIAVGYGRAGTDRFSKIGPQWLQSRLTVEKGDTVGRNSYGFTTGRHGTILPVDAVTLTPTGRRTHLALTQTYQRITEPERLGGHRRNMVRETTLAAYKEDPKSGNHFEHEVLELWANEHVYTGHHWAMTIDLNRCTGCSACVISCQAENNVPVVGKDEVYRRRELHWIRIDRYYSGTDGDVDVMYQPVMCQHCDHAPCESVCPVLATVHSDEGINQQIYNRCVGTRYCANNCPYKVRRFNWFDYRHRGEEENLVLNPDVTTRSRGVMEKCSLCVQRIQSVKAEAKRRGKPVADGDIQVACQQSCPADAIVFGDMNDPESRVTALIENPRHYQILEEMNFRPTVGYLTKVRNRDGQA